MVDQMLSLPVLIVSQGLATSPTGHLVNLGWYDLAVDQMPLAYLLEGSLPGRMDWIASSTHEHPTRSSLVRVENGLDRTVDIHTSQPGCYYLPV